MKNKPLHISIPNPCTQNWDEMQPLQNGKHCLSCDEIIYDFSQMSDGELLNFFKENKTIHCGRFYNTQLNRTITSVQKKRKLIITKFNKIAAAVFAVLTFKSVVAQTNVNNNTTYAVLNSPNQLLKTTLTKFVISGIIKDKEGMPITNASILFDSLNMAKSDKDGKFLFEVENITNSNHTLYFNYADFNTVVRTYHPSMQSTNYDVQMIKPSGENWTMGVMIMPGEALGELPSLLFKQNAIKISKQNKELLNDVAYKLKANPDGKILIVAYPPICGKTYIGLKRVELLKKYLVNGLGISQDRISTNCIVDGGDVNTIDIKSDN